MAEGILKSMLQERGIDNIEVSSAGIGSMGGYPATPFAIEAARTWGVDISDHRSRELTRELIQAANLILAMSPEHVKYILRLDRSAADKTFLIKGFPEPYSPSQEGVRDPIGGTLEEYNQTYMELDEIIRRLENIIVKRAESFKKES